MNENVVGDNLNKGVESEDDLTYREGDIPPECGEKLDGMFSNLHEKFGMNIGEEDPLEHRVRSVYDSVIHKFKSDRDFNTRFVDQEVSKALGDSTSATIERNATEMTKRERSPLWKLIPRVPRYDSAPLVPYFNDDLNYILKEVATYEEIPEPFLEEERFLDIFSEDEVSHEKYNIDAYLGIINVNERSRGFYRLRHLKCKPHDEVYSKQRILRYIEVNSEYQNSHGYVEYNVVRSSFYCLLMANTNASPLILSSGSMEQQTHMALQNTNSPQQNRNISDGPIAILWDMENCPVPSDMCPEDAAASKLALPLLSCNLLSWLASSVLSSFYCLLMANTNASPLILSSGSMEQQTHMSLQNTNSPQQNRNISDGPIAILWDMENCPVPSDMCPEDAAGNIRMALRVHPIINGTVTVFSAYGDFNGFSRRLREGCQRTGVKLVDVPNGRKDAADKAILVDMFLFALDNPPPACIMLISGDVDFSHALHVLGQRGYTVIIAIPSGVGVSYALRNAGSFVWDWPSVVRGEGFVPSSRPMVGPNPVYQMTGNSNYQNEEEAIVYRGISQSYYNSKGFSMVSQSLSEYNSIPCLPTTSRSFSYPNGLNEMSVRQVSSYEQNDLMWVQPGDLTGLKGQLVKLLDSCGGCLSLARLPAEYQKSFGRPLYVSEYGTLKLVDLLKTMGDKIAIEGKGQRRFVYLKKCLAGPISSPLDMGKTDVKGKNIREENTDAGAGIGSSDEFSDDERVVLEEQDLLVDERLDEFKFELQEILVSCSCRILLGCFEAIYQQRYKRPLDYRRFGVSDLEELFEKMGDVVVLVEEPVSRMNVVRGEGFVPSSRPMVGPNPVYQMTDNSNYQNEEEAIVYRGISQSYYNSKGFSMVSQSLSEYNSIPCLPTTSRSFSYPNGLNEMSVRQVSSYEQNDLMWVQPGDLTGLKGQLVKLLDSCGGCLSLARLPAEYQKSFGRPLYVSEYGTLKLVDLLKTMGDKIAIEGKGQRRFVYLKKCLAGPISSPLDMGKTDVKGKNIREENTDAGAGIGSSDEFSDDERVVLEEQDLLVDERLDEFKFELQEILVSCSCRILLGCFEAIYQQRYKRPLDYRRFGVSDLEELFEKMGDVVVLVEEPHGTRLMPQFNPFLIGFCQWLCDGGLNGLQTSTRLAHGFEEEKCDAVQFYCHVALEGVRP
ncbi:Limkain-b1 [Artemisia annua]|uniref:Limkain-b1 n=1 Tax=Artemisia annua TaxID=35608 RepID=A0A2U1PEK3_ARTAN|nr:Limkain-b1 [Artemisia annua]